MLRVRPDSSTKESGQTRFISSSFVTTWPLRLDQCCKGLESLRCKEHRLAVKKETVFASIQAKSPEFIGDIEVVVGHPPNRSIL
jgi:hypothetical protein